jgi:hypothetical protein
MRHRKPDATISRRVFLSLTNKAGIALISAGGVLSVIPPAKVLSAAKGGGIAALRKTRPVQKTGTVATPTRKDGIVVSSALAFEDKTYLINSEGSFVWNLCNGRHDVNMVSQALSLKYRKAPAPVEADVFDFVETLRSLNLVEFVN